ncbi:uncharacterized protein LOC110923922 [Helianthus annuus]|uniref:uncharacterized protein LOC110923922 n=1 Tax=Helianthus annuus TaxID=4232 RepID=UPI000B904CB4|nr:uncharacterized protein LOC110923922 [Helianthus annuus]
MPNKSDSSVTLVSKLDASDPLYLHASDSSCLTIVSIKLKGTENYVVCSNAMKLALMELYVGQVYSRLASEVWDDLKDTYDKVDGSVVFGLFQKINSVSQNGASVSEYYHKINTMWKQFDAMLQLPSCTCNASTKFNEFNQLIKLMQFLMSLYDIYQPVRTNLLTRDPLPTIKTAFSVISREESHRGSNNGSKAPNVGFAAKINNFNDNKKRFNKGPNPNLKCTHCNKIGHTVDKCYELHGYPTNYRQKPNQNGQWSKSNNSTNSNNSLSVNNSMSDKSASSLNTLSLDQFSKLLGLLNENKTEESNNLNWIIDSGANQHMVMTSENMFNLVDVSEYNITIKHPNGTNAKVTNIGSFKLSDSVILKDVFVVPEYYVNLISVYKLAKDNKLRVIFDEILVTFRIPAQRKPWLPSSVLHGCSPYEMLFGFKPSLDHLKVFGCLCYFTILDNSDKLEERAEKCVFMGYSNLKKGYKVWSLEQRKFIFSRDVSFHETVFPFKNNTHEQISTNLLNQLNFFDNFETSSDTNPNDEEKDVTDSTTVTQQHSDAVVSTVDSDTQQSSGSDVEAERNESMGVATETVRAESSGISDESNLPEGTQNIRRSTRSAFVPKRFDDYIVGNAKYSYDKVVNYSNLPSETICFAANINKIIEPCTYKDALDDKRWIDVMNDELSALYKNNTWDIVDLPSGKKPIGCKWVFKVKYKLTGEVDRFKARLVAKGFNKREGKW